MFRLMLFLFGFLLSSMWRPDDPPADDPDPPADPPDEPYKKLEFKTKEEADSHYNSVFKERDARIREQIREEERAEAESELKKKAAKDAEDFRALYEEADGKVATQAKQITDLQTEVDRLASELEGVKPHRDVNEARAKELLKNAPEAIQQALSDWDPLKQLKWLDDNPEYASAGNGRPAGSPRTGPPANRGGDKEKDKEARESQRQARVSTI